MKDFLKINRYKIWGTIILGIINSGLAFYSAIALFAVLSPYEPNFWQTFFGFTTFPFVIVLYITEFFEGFRLLPEVLMITLTLLFSIIILVIFWYLLVCIINKVISLLRKR
jgi:hypothetical protein